MTETTTTGTRPARPVRQLLAASVGNAVEWYDWYCPAGSGRAAERVAHWSNRQPSSIF